MAREYGLTERQAALAFQQIDSHCKALHNWIASAVEKGDMERATMLVKQLREHQELYAVLNVEAHKFIDGFKAEAQAQVKA